MKTENIYAEIVAMLKCYERETGRDYGGTDEWLQDVVEMRETAKYDGENIYASAARILLDLREKMDKKASSAGRVNVCKRLVKSIDAQGRNSMGGILPVDGRYCIMDGFRAFRFSADLPSIRRAIHTFDYDKFFSPFSRDAETLPPVSRAEIKEFIAVSGQTRTKCSVPFTPAAWPAWYAVNPFYLLDVLDAMPDAVFYLPESYFKPLYFADDDGNDGILLPVRAKRTVEAWHKYQEEKQSKERRSA